MSAAPFLTVREREREQVKRSPRSQRAAVAEPTTRPNVSPRCNHKATYKRASKGVGIEWILGQLALFGLVVAATFLFSVLMGNSLMEKARHDTIKAQGRTKVARQDMVRLRSRLDRLTNTAVVADWASARGFVPSYAAVETSTDAQTH
ncbi:MAG: hypothetical protein LCH41_05650 [Armatimonadetes bacterium]|nr:hypothetical protein [Armatimonadota bacterium]